MFRKRTSRVKRKTVGTRQLNVRVNHGRIMWSRARRRPLRLMKWVLCLLFLAGFILLGKSSLQRIFHESGEFTLRKVELWQWEGEELPKLVGHARLAEVTGLEPTASIFSFDLKKIQRQLEVLPEVKRVRVTRRLPNVLRIRLEERIPVAWIDSPRHHIVGRDYHRGLLVDGEGICFRPAMTMFDVVNDLPVITTGDRKGAQFTIGGKMKDREFMQALELVKLSQRYLGEAGWSIPVIGLRNEFSLLAKTHTGTVVTFGLYDHDRQLSDLLLILERARKTSRGVSRVNLIPERNIPVVFAKTGGQRESPKTRLESELESILTRG